MKKHVKTILGVLGGLAALAAAAAGGKALHTHQQNKNFVSNLGMMQSDHANKQSAHLRALANGATITYKKF